MQVRRLDDVTCCWRVPGGSSSVGRAPPASRECPGQTLAVGGPKNGGHRESNPGHSPEAGGALPTELLPPGTPQQQVTSSNLRACMNLYQLT